MKLLKRKNPIDAPYAPEGTTQRVDESRLPLDPTTKQPLAPTAQPGYYPGFETLSQQAFWDEATRKVVLDRVEHIPPVRFFTAGEAELVQAVCDRILPQDDRDEAHKIPIVPTIDERLYTGRIDGYRYEDMPTDRDAHRLGLQGIQAVAQHMYGKSFTELGPREQDAVLQTIHDCNPPAGDHIWQKLPVRRYWMLLVQDAVEAYYAHPFAWDEIGFGGPAYPRGYMRLEGGKPEPWEVYEQRYEWEAPHTSLSDIYKPIGGPGGHKSQPSGQEGTH